MSNHQASEQMLGYLYQVRCALKLLLENDNSDFQISIEKFDDVAFSQEGVKTSCTTQRKPYRWKYGLRNTGCQTPGTKCS